MAQPSDEEATPTRQSTMPPWLAAANALGVSFEDAAAPPPWLQAAVEQGLGEGVVFYDPEGREIEVPASKVPAFTEGLDKVRAFEQSWSNESAPGSSQLLESSLPGYPSASLPHAADKEMTKAGGEEPSRNSQRRVDLKAYVQKMYFALLREGLEPNEAAALAIRQAAQVDVQRDTQTATPEIALPAPPPPLAGSQRCSSTAQKLKQSQQKPGERQEEVTVSA